MTPPASVQTAKTPPQPPEQKGATDSSAVLIRVMVHPTARIDGLAARTDRHAVAVVSILLILELESRIVALACGT